MASILPVPGGFRAQVARRGVRESKTFADRAEAKAWAARREHEILSGTGPKQVARSITLHSAILRFQKEESPKRQGARWENFRLAKFLRELPAVPLVELAPKHLAAWRNARLAVVAPGTVRREMSVLMSVLETARRDWGWLTINPLKDVKKPSAPRPRGRIISDAERDAVIAALHYTEEGPILAPQQRVAVAFLLALETAMRAGELRKCVVLGKIARLDTTKNGDPRDVPLSLRARELFAKVGGRINLSSGSLDALFRAARERAGLSGFTFHDARATACTKMARRGIDVLTLAKIIGHRDPKSLMIYYRESSESIADRLG